MMTGKRNLEIGRQAALLLAAIMAAVLLSSGVALAVTKQCQAQVDCFGTRKADTLKGSVGTDYVYGRGGGDTVKGLGGFDQLNGQGGRDRLFGGPDADTLAGGTGKDASNGGEDHDNYAFGPGWGNDTITDGSDSPNTIFFSEGLSSLEWVTEDLTITLVPGPGPEVTDASGTNTVNWDGNVITSVTGGHGDDEITGNALANYIDGNLGADTVIAGGGNDNIHMVDGSGGDIVDCGENLVGDADNDVVFHDPGDTISPNCESTLSS